MQRKSLLLTGEEYLEWNRRFKLEGFPAVVLEKILESPLECKEIQPVHSEGDQSWVFIGRMLLKPKFQSFGHLMQRADSFEKTLMLGKIEKIDQVKTFQNWENFQR